MQDVVSALGAQWLTTTLLLSVRIAAVLLLTPLLYAAAMPLTVRVLVVVGAACVMALPFASATPVAVHDVGTLVAAMLREAGIGAVLGLGILMAFGGFALAGRLLDVQVGFGMADVFDPLTRSRAPILSAVFGLFAAVFFFVVDGHHAVLRGIAYSVERFPVGLGWLPSQAADPLARQMGALFALGFALAAPVVLVLLLLDCALAVVSRNLPQMNMIVMGVPVKVLVGLAALTVWAAGLEGPARRLYAGIYQSWATWLSAGGLR